VLIGVIQLVDRCRCRCEGMMEVISSSLLVILEVESTRVSDLRVKSSS
jgi:hypothetical protein